MALPQQFSLTHKFWLFTSLLLVLSALLGTSAIITLRGIYTSARASVAHYQAMDRAEGVMTRVTWLRDSLRGADGQRYLDAQFYGPIRTDLSGVDLELSHALAGGDVDGGQADLAHAVTEHFEAAAARSQDVSGKDRTTLAAAVAAELDRVNQSLASLVKLAPDAARRQTNVTLARVQSALWWTCVWLAIVLGVSSIIHYRQYRLLVRPLVSLRDDIRRSSANDFRDAIRIDGELEFREVATFFNGLAGDLAQLYRTLEQKVIERSRALVRSERLASVGFLAAGVAHEINNPLSVISGYAELSEQSIRRVLDADHDDGVMSEANAAVEAEALMSALDTQQIIREEAFRCKEITNRLLSLARGGGDERQPLRLEEVARQVTVLTRGLKNYRDRRVALAFVDDASLDVVANPTEMKQVLLNLTVNALEASRTNGGEVRIGGGRVGDWVEVYVQDVGKGMTPDTLQRIFEPFYTEKRGVGEAGTGLGLTITHAIIENHGGTIHAESDGIGTGSRFTIRLPATTRDPQFNRAAAPALLN